MKLTVTFDIEGKHKYTSEAIELEPKDLDDKEGFEYLEAWASGALWGFLLETRDVLNREQESST